MFGKGYYNTAQLRVAGQKRSTIRKFSNGGALVLAADFNMNEEESYDPEDDVEIINNIIGSNKDIYANSVGFQNHQDDSPIKPSYFTFNGSSSFLGTPKSGGSHEGESSFDLNIGNDFTLACWVRLTGGVSASSGATLMGIGDTSDNGISFLVNNYKPECNFEGAKNLASFSMEVNEWYNLVLIKESSAVYLYVDGSYRVGSNENIGSSASGTSEVFLARAYDGTNYSYTGSSTNMSRVLIYDSALKASDIRRNYLALRTRYK